MADSAGAMQRRGLVDGPDFEFFQRRYFTPAEVAEHNLPEDLWVSYLGSVYDLTPLAQEHKDPQARRSADRNAEIPHPPGPLSARPASAAPFRLGQRFREALVAGDALRGGAAVGQDPEHPHH